MEPYIIFSDHFKEVKKELEGEALQKAVFQISQATGKATDLPALYKIVHEIISSLIPTPNLFIATYDDTSEFISFPYYVDERDYLDVIEKQKLRSRDRKVRRGLTEYLIHRGEPLLINREILDDLTEAGEISVVGSNRSNGWGSTHHSRRRNHRCFGHSNVFRKCSLHGT